MGILFTAEEKAEAYQRIISGNRAMGCAMLAHTVRVGKHNVNNFRAMGEEALANKANCAYRLVERGMITTLTAFTEKSHILLGDK